MPLLKTEQRTLPVREDIKVGDVIEADMLKGFGVAINDTLRRLIAPIDIDGGKIRSADDEDATVVTGTVEDFETEDYIITDSDTGAEFTARRFTSVTWSLSNGVRLTLPMPNPF